MRNFNWTSRRSFAAGSGLLFASLATRAALGQPVSRNAVRAAIVIGIDQARDLPPLRAAVSGAEEVSSFLEQENFEVFKFTDLDETGRYRDVRAYQIADQIEELVNRGTLDQLVIYFAGHGTLSGASEYWLLSKASSQTSEAISTLETAHFARLAGIPNVVFISDACRSVSASFNFAMVTGQAIFPTPRNAPTGRVDVDQFFAALPGDPALEIPVSDSVERYEGIYTSAFLKAFREPDRDMIYTLHDGTNVVPNRKLREFLVREVQARAQARSIRLNQIPDAFVNSDLPSYIARSARTRASSPHRGDIDLPAASVSGGLQSLLGLAARDSFQLSDAIDGNTGNPNPYDDDARKLVERATKLDVILPTTGVAIYGGKISDIDGIEIEFFQESNRRSSESWLVDIGQRNAATILISFEDGCGCVAALLKDFSLHITLGKSGIVDLRYNPTEESASFYSFLNEVDYTNGSPGRIALLRSLATEAKRSGVLRFEGNSEDRYDAARGFASQIRMGKNIDPTLGIYAAYAYALGFFEDGAKSVRRFMRDDLQADLFDARLLAGEFSGYCGDDGFPVVPSVPMMRQGWEFLRVNDVTLNLALNEARKHLKESLWTTFDPEGMAILKEHSHAVFSSPC